MLTARPLNRRSSNALMALAASVTTTVLLHAASRTAAAQPGLQLELPFPNGTAYRCTQGPGGAFSHTDPFTRFDLDFDTPNDSAEPVLAAADGIAFVHPSRGEKSLGKHVNIDHGDGLFTVYAHLSRVLVRNRQPISSGEVIGLEGSTGFATGDHLHFGLHSGDPAKDAMASRSISITGLLAANQTTGTSESPLGSTDFFCQLEHDSEGRVIAIGDAYMSSNGTPDLTPPPPAPSPGPSASPPEPGMRPPSQPELEAAVRRSLARAVPVSWVGNLAGGRAIRIDSVELVEMGEFNPHAGYWPARVHAVGVCRLKDPFAGLGGASRNRAFNGTTEFVLTRDDYGNWQASLARGRFQ